MIGIFGLQATGKDTVAEIIANEKERRVVSLSRVMMKAIGLPVEIDAKFKVPKEFYLRIESLSEQERLEILNGGIRAELLKLKSEYPDSIYLGHLQTNIPDNFGKINVITSGFVQEWFSEVFDGVVHFK